MHSMFREEESIIKLSPGKVRNRLADKIIEEDWEYVIDRTFQCPGEVSEWVNVSVCGFFEKLLPLHVACTLGPPVEVIQALLNADKETVMLRDANGRLPLHLACDVERASIDIVKILLKNYPNGAQIKETQFGFLPLHAACCIRENARKTNVKGELQLKVIKTLLSFYPDGVTMKDDHGWLPLALACRTGAHLPVIKALLDEHPNAAKVMDREMRMPLHLALCARPSDDEAAEIARILIAADPTSLMRKEKRFGFLPLHVACSFSGLSSSCAVVRTLLVAYPEASQQPDLRGSLPLHLACRSGAPVSVIQQLISIYPQGASHPDTAQRLPLHWACHLNLSSECISILLDAYPAAARSAEAKYHFLPLHVACLRGCSYKVIKILSEAYSNGPFCRDKSGCLPLHIACKCKDGISTDTIQSLVWLHPKALCVKNFEGVSPVDLAKENIANLSTDIVDIMVDASTNRDDCNISTSDEKRVEDFEIVNNMTLLDISSHKIEGRERYLLPDQPQPSSLQKGLNVTSNKNYPQTEEKHQ